jgi:poly-gamma-glutamate synthesis protein (capsule biosynthesis protein)
MLNGIKPSKQVFQALQGLTRSSDLSFGNLEIPLTTAATRTDRKTELELKARTQWILKANPNHAPYIAEAGIRIVSLANNHAMDYGASGLKEMIDRLDQAKILHAGAGPQANAAMRPVIAELPNGRKLALLSVMGFLTKRALLKTTPATLASPGAAALNLNGSITQTAREKLRRWIQACRDTADYVVIGIHWGVERKNLPTAYQVALGRALVDAGADIVWGNHPHVLQGAEFYKGHLIMYSMGNLISNLPADTGFFQVRIGEGDALSARFIPARDSGGRVLMLSPNRRAAAIRSMRALCRLLLHRYPSPVSVPAL